MNNSQSHKNHDNEFKFEKWTVWSASKSLCSSTMLITQNFPKEERIGLAMKIRSEAFDLMGHLAAASAIYDQDQKISQLDLALSNGQTFASFIFLAKDLEWIDPPTSQKLLDTTSKISAQILGLKKSILNRDRDTDQNSNISYRKKQSS